MPTYQYSCTDCGHFFEVVQSFSDDSLTQCPSCEGRLRKVFNAVGVVFKGSGFYRTDSRGGSSASAASSSGSSGSADSSSSGSSGSSTTSSGSTTAGSASGSSTGSGPSGAAGTAASSSSGGSGS